MVSDLYQAFLKIMKMDFLEDSEGVSLPFVVEGVMEVATVPAEDVLNGDLVLCSEQGVDTK